MPVSFDSERPILTNEKTGSKSSQRGSTHSKTPSTPSEHSDMSMATGGDLQAADFKRYTTSLDRMADKRLQDQRYTITEQQESEMSKLALAGKVQKALERRYQNQDAVMKPKKVLSEKT